MGDSNYKTTVKKNGDNVRITIDSANRTVVYNVTNVGCVTDRSGAAIGRSDITIIVMTLRGKGHAALATKVLAWWDSQ